MRHVKVSEEWPWDGWHMGFWRASQEEKQNNCLPVSQEGVIGSCLRYKLCVSLISAPCVGLGLLEM